jgi:hypothetical protein
MGCHEVVSEDGRYPLEIVQGEAGGVDIVLYDENDGLLDLTGRTGIAQVREHPGLQWPVLVDMTVTHNDDGGIVSVRWSESATASITTKGVWDCRLVADDLDPIIAVKLSPVNVVRQVSYV